MPQYYRLPDNWHGRGKAKVIHFPLWRNTPIGRIVNYKVGDRITFYIGFENINFDTKQSRHWVYEVRNGQTNTLFNIDERDAVVRGNYIDSPGSIAYFLATHGREELILTAEVMPKFISSGYLKRIARPFFIGIALATIILWFLQSWPMR